MRKGRGKVLVVDDEDAIVLGLVRVLYQDNADYDVLIAKNGEIGQQILRENSIDVLVTDVRLPGMSGLDLLCWASTESPTTRVIVMTSYDVAEARQQAYGLGCLTIIQKPFDIHHMRDTVVAALDRNRSFAGSLSELSPADVIQMLCLGRKTTGLRVVQGSSSGLVCVRDGEVVHAVWNDLQGEQAFFHALQATRGIFSTVPLLDQGQTTIDTGWQQLLLEGMRLKDEGALDVAEEEDTILDAPTPRVGPPPIPEIAPSAQAKRPSGGDGAADGGRAASSAPSTHDVASLIDEGFDAMRAGDLDLARECWEAAFRLDPRNRMIELNLRRLEHMGVR